jgi:hypothetical protein
MSCGRGEVEVVRCTYHGDTLVVQEDGMVCLVITSVSKIDARHDRNKVKL